ncbi:hypothetical protein AVEN_153003-1 [Araneus ventricosus]|uniref:Uncharacterized protein n=1 Tax=Araneus ventricosus TaxID=182803 RepID=A0A4Y2AEZ7_ARAVE|nr:hypothetical protein AVEN_153003-1 [Araneus ventricosus]
MLAHGAGVSCLHPTVRIAKKFHPFKEISCWPSQGPYRTTPDGCITGNCGDPTSASPNTARCQNNRIVQTPKQNSRHFTPQSRGFEHRVTGWTTHPSKHLHPH